MLKENNTWRPVAASVLYMKESFCCDHLVFRELHDNKLEAISAKVFYKIPELLHL